MDIQIERILEHYKATGFMYGWSEQHKSPKRQAFKDAKALADWVVTLDGHEYPAFHVMSDARACAMLLRETPGIVAYVRELDSTNDPLKVGYWVAGYWDIGLVD